MDNNTDEKLSNTHHTSHPTSKSTVSWQMPVVQRTACTSEDQSLNLNYAATDIGRAEDGWALVT